MPYAQSPNVRKLSKISSLLLARNYIISLQKSLDEAHALLKQVNPALVPKNSVSNPISPESLEAAKTKNTVTSIAETFSSTQIMPPMVTPSLFSNGQLFPWLQPSLIQAPSQQTTVAPPPPFCLKMLGDVSFPCPCVLCSAQARQPPILTHLPK